MRWSSRAGEPGSRARGDRMSTERVTPAARVRSSGGLINSPQPSPWGAVVEQTRPVRGQQQHEHNLALVARLVAAHGPVSRAAVARRSGLTKTTVTQLTGELLDGGLLRELGLGRADG
ncbi:DNA glycosylase AlkZ-like family protein, partial [Saccharomonospora halophila]|uniref:DNA glycosylase AlkZ-like family protein n=1 Tax=Saccharomonospora halophila TaxID=129922 RepID=UPI0038CDA10A